MRKEGNLIKVDDVKIKEDIYPRHHWSWNTAYGYAKMMEAKAQFPPIVIAQTNKGYFLVDGRHRLEAHKLNNEKYISAEILKGLTKKQIFIEAVKRNMGHGRSLSSMDKAKIIVRLEELNYPMKEISEIVRVPVGDLKSFVSKRVTSSITGKEIVLKKSLKHLAKDDYSYETHTEREIDDVQANIDGGRSQLTLVKEIRLLIERDLIDKHNRILVSNLSMLYKRIGAFLSDLKDEKDELSDLDLGIQKVKKKKATKKVIKKKRGRPKKPLTKSYRIIKGR